MTPVITEVCARCGADPLYEPCRSTKTCNYTTVQGQQIPQLDYASLQSYAQKHRLNYTELCGVVRDAALAGWLRERRRLEQEHATVKTYYEQDLEEVRSLYLRQVADAIDRLETVSVALTRRLPKVAAIKAVVEELVCDLQLMEQKLKQ